MLKSVQDPDSEVSLAEPWQCDIDSRSVRYRTSRSGVANGWKNVYGYLWSVFCFRQQTPSACLKLQCLCLHQISSVWQFLMLGEMHASNTHDVTYYCSRPVPSQLFRDRTIIQFFSEQAQLRTFSASRRVRSSVAFSTESWMADHVAHMAGLRVRTVFWMER